MFINHYFRSPRESKPGKNHFRLLILCSCGTHVRRLQLGKSNGHASRLARCRIAKSMIIKRSHIAGFLNTSNPAWFHSRSEEHMSELQSQSNLVCRLLLEKKKSRMPRSSSQYPGTI